MRYLEKSWWPFLIKSSSFVQSESELIHFFESRFLDESKLIHSGVYVNLYAYPLWLLPLWAGTCFASIACGHPHAHFWGVPQTPWGRSASIKKASRRIKRLAFYKEIRTTHLAGILQLQIPRGRLIPQDLAQLPHGIAQMLTTGRKGALISVQSLRCRDLAQRRKARNRSF